MTHRPYSMYCVRVAGLGMAAVLAACNGSPPPPAAAPVPPADTAPPMTDSTPVPPAPAPAPAPVQARPAPAPSYAAPVARPAPAPTYAQPTYVPTTPTQPEVVSVYIDPPTYQPPPVAVRWAPPPMLVEAPPPPPYPEAVWVGGYWAWQGQWVWATGRWARPPRPNYAYVQPYYEHRDRDVIFIAGHWAARGTRFTPPPRDLHIDVDFGRPGGRQGPPPTGPFGVFVPPPPGSRPGLIIPAPIGTAPAVVTSAPAVNKVGMQIRGDNNRVVEQKTVNNSRVSNVTQVTNNINNVTIVAPPGTTTDGRAFKSNVPAQANLAAALKPAAPLAAPAAAATPPARPAPPIAAAPPARPAPGTLPPPRPTAVAAPATAATRPVEAVPPAPRTRAERKAEERAATATPTAAVPAPSAAVPAPTAAVPAPAPARGERPVSRPTSVEAPPPPRATSGTPTLPPTVQPAARPVVQPPPRPVTDLRTAPPDTRSDAGRLPSADARIRQTAERASDPRRINLTDAERAEAAREKKLERAAARQREAAEKP